MDRDDRAIQRSLRLRAVALIAHRYVGLFMAVFLLVAGLTGSAVAFFHELDGALNPELMRVTVPPRAQPLDPLVQREMLLAQLPPGVRADYLSLEHERGTATRFYVEPPDDSRGDDEYFVDPYRGHVVGSRRYGDLSQGARNLLPFLYRLHYSLALGTVGTYLMGAVALLWTLDCFVGAYLTFPPRSRRPRERAWLVRWKPAWLVRANHLFALVFTWHRASGLWVWAMLLVFAWSAVGLNLGEVYTPVMRVALGMSEGAYESLAELPAPRRNPALSWLEARDRGRELMASQGKTRGFRVMRDSRMSHDSEHGVYRYVVHSSLDLSDRYPDTTLWLDSDTGALRAFHAPSGENAGITATSLIYALHFGAIAGGGLAYRIFVCVLGVAIALLSITGVWIWWRKWWQTATRRA